MEEDNLNLIEEQRIFVLSKKQWEAFCAALDAPANVKPSLKALMTEPSLFETQKK